MRLTKRTKLLMAVINLHNMKYLHDWTTFKNLWLKSYIYESTVLVQLNKDNEKQANV